MKAIVAGATGLIGTELVKQISGDSSFEKSLIVSRRDCPVEPKFELSICDFEDLAPVKFETKFDVAFCCLGTTIKVAGSQDAFRRVDFDYVLDFAHLCKRNGVTHFVLVSSIGANSHSNTFYSRVKGQVEDALRALHFVKLSIVRPSLLLGDRKEFRLGESLAKFAAPVVQKLIPKSSQHYRPVEAKRVASVLIDVAKGHLDAGKHDGFEVILS